MQQIEEQLGRETLPLPRLKINPEITNIFDFVYDDFELQGYESHSAISAPVAV
jgi:thymidylate synthase